MPPQENAYSPFAEIAKRDLSLADSRIDELPAPIFLPATVGPPGELPDRRLFLKTLALPCAAACAMALTRNSFALNPATWDAGSEDDLRAYRSHREEAVLPFPSRAHGLFSRDCGMQCELQVLPELGDLASPAGRFAGAIPASEGTGSVGRDKSLCCRLVHLQRTNHF